MVLERALLIVHLLAYYEPESENDIAFSCSNLKEMFYVYLLCTRQKNITH